MSIEQRLARVERQNRIFKGLFTVAGAAVAALVFYGATEPIPEVVQARRFEIVNEAGNTVLEMNSELGSGKLTIWNKDGKVIIHAGTGITTESGELRIKNKDGNEIIHVGADFLTGNGMLTIRNKDGNETIRAGARVNGDGLLIIGDKNGNAITHVGVESNGGGMLMLKNKDRKQIFYAAAGVIGDGLLKILTKNGKNMIYAGGVANGGIIEIDNKTGETVIQLVVNKRGNGVVGVYNRSGKGRTFRIGP